MSGGWFKIECIVLRLFGSIVLLAVDAFHVVLVVVGEPEVLAGSWHDPSVVAGAPDVRALVLFVSSLRSPLMSECWFGALDVTVLITDIMVLSKIRNKVVDLVSQSFAWMFILRASGRGADGIGLETMCLHRVYWKQSGNSKCQNIRFHFRLYNWFEF